MLSHINPQHTKVPFFATFSQFPFFPSQRLNSSRMCAYLKVRWVKIVNTATSCNDDANDRDAIVFDWSFIFISNFFHFLVCMLNEWMNNAMKGRTLFLKEETLEGMTLLIFKKTHVYDSWKRLVKCFNQFYCFFFLAHSNLCLNAETMFYGSMKEFSNSIFYLFFFNLSMKKRWNRLERGFLLPSSFFTWISFHLD